jgi:hypothetical protein
MATQIVIDFGETTIEDGVKLKIALNGSNVMEIAVASVQLRSIVEQTLGKEDSDDLFENLITSSTVEEEENDILKRFPGKPTTQA